MNLEPGGQGYSVDGSNVAPPMADFQSFGGELNRLLVGFSTGPRRHANKGVKVGSPLKARGLPATQSLSVKTPGGQKKSVLVVVIFLGNCPTIDKLLLLL